MAWARPDYNAVLVPDDGSPDIDIRHTANIWTGQLNGTFVFTDKAVSPFVEAGLGWTNFDSNVASEPPITGCWWDPWWGYICSNFYSTSWRSSAVLTGSDLVAMDKKTDNIFEPFNSIYII